MQIFWIFLLIIQMSLPVYAQRITDADVINGISTNRNYIQNPTARRSGSVGVSTSNAAVARDTDTADKLDGIASFTCDASAQDGYCAWATTTIAEGDKTGNCMATASFKGDASLYKLSITDTSNTLSLSSVLTNETDWKEVVVNYPCGSTRDVRLVQTEAGTGAAVNIGRITYGKANNIGSLNNKTDPMSYTPTFTGFGTVSSVEIQSYRDGSFLYIDGNFTSGTPTTTEARMTIGFSGTSANVTTSAITSIRSAGDYVHGTASVAHGGMMLAEPSLTYLTFGSVSTFGDASVAPLTKVNGDAISANGMKISVKAKVPITGWATSTVYTPSQEEWQVIADITGANPSLGVAAVASYTEITDAGLTMTPVTGSAPAGIMCEDTNAATAPSTGATVCAAGSEAIGANFNIPYAGWYDACFSFTHFIGLDSAEQIYTGFQVAQTATTCGTSPCTTMTYEGGPRTLSGSAALTIATGADQTLGFPHTICGDMYFSSAGNVGIRLMYEQFIAGSPDSSLIYADASVSLGQPAIRMTVKPSKTKRSGIILAGSVNARYTSTAGANIVTDTIIDFATKDYDSHNSVTTGSSWKFTAPTSGAYEVHTNFFTAAATAGAITQGVGARLSKNAAAATTWAAWAYAITTSSVNKYIQGTFTVKLLAGETVSLLGVNSTTQTHAMSAGAGENYIEIKRVGDY